MTAGQITELNTFGKINGFKSNKSGERRLKVKSRKATSPRGGVLGS